MSGAGPWNDGKTVGGGLWWLGIIVANPSGSSGQAGIGVWPLQLQASPHPLWNRGNPSQNFFTLTKMSSNGEKASWNYMFYWFYLSWYLTLYVCVLRQRGRV